MMNNISAPLQKILSARRESVTQVVGQAQTMEMPIYLVGGFVRDVLLEKPVNDFDLVVEGDATKLGRALVQHFGGRVTVHAPFKTATWFPQNLSQDTPPLDLISARSETYAHPAALPTIKLGALTDDLLRRDFTINAMAVRLDGDHFGELTDPHGGQADLERGLVRVLHPNSFVDDPTRLFRAVRYAARYGFGLAPETEILIPAALPYVDKLSPERLRHELDLIFEEEDSVPMMEKLWALGIVQAVSPALPSEESTRARFQQTRSHFFMPPRAIPPEVVVTRDRRWIVWLMGISQKEIRVLSKRLAFTADLLKKILGASSVYTDLEYFRGIRPSQCVRRLGGIPDDSVMAAYFCAPHDEPRSMLEGYLTGWKTMKPFTTGETLEEMGVPFGPIRGEILWRLRAAWVDGDVTSENDENNLLEKLVGDERNDEVVENQ
jgi:tRNA nucleotidyltransferase (CCA-adding enzyme)